MLDKKYKAIELDLVLEKKRNPLMKFSLSDNQTSDFYINVTRNNGKIDLTDYKVTLYVKTPKNEVINKQLLSYDKESNLFYCNLDTDFKNVVGKYLCELLIEDENTTEKIVPLNDFYYEVKDDIISGGGSIPIDPDPPVTTLEAEYDSTTQTLKFNCDAEYDEATGKIILTYNANHDVSTRVSSLDANCEMK